MSVNPAYYKKWFISMYCHCTKEKNILVVWQKKLLKLHCDKKRETQKSERWKEIFEWSIFFCGCLRFCKTKHVQQNSSGMMLAKKRYNFKKMIVLSEKKYDRMKKVGQNVIHLVLQNSLVLTLFPNKKRKTTTSTTKQIIRKVEVLFFQSFEL